MLASSAGALYAASFGGWTFAYMLMAALMLVGIATVWLTPEPAGIDSAAPVAGTSANPLYVLLGFTKVEIATVAKIYGVVATLAGVAAGGIMVARLGVLH